MKNFLIILGLAVMLLIGALWWSGTRRSDTDPLIARNGLHWHPELVIYIKGEQVEIPPDTGLIGVHNPIYTHEDLPIIHMEFTGLVRESDTKLSNFFKVWGKDFSGFGENVSMTVNGTENNEFENYHMKDGDKIELRYE